MYTRVLSLRILAISVTRHIFCETYQDSEYGSYFNMAYRGLVDSRMNIQCMYYRKHPISVHVCVEPMWKNIKLH